MNEYKDLNDYEIIYMVKENSEEATNILFEKYKPIIINLAKKYKSLSGNCGLELEDFMQEGNYALFYAIKKYSEKRDSLFYTYAVLCIKSKMQNLLTRSTTNKNKPLNNGISLYKEIGENSELLDFIEDKNAILPEEMFDRNLISNKIKSIIYELPFEYSLVAELKMNGFSVNDMAILLDKTNVNISRILKSVRDKLNKLR